jgi:hypothetical protein
MPVGTRFFVPTQFPVKWAPCHFPGDKAARAWRWPPQLAPRIKKEYRYNSTPVSGFMVGYRVKFLCFTFQSYIGESLCCFKLLPFRHWLLTHCSRTRRFLISSFSYFSFHGLLPDQGWFPFLCCLQSSPFPVAVEKKLTIGYMFIFFHSMCPLLLSLLFLSSWYLLILARDFTHPASHYSLCSAFQMLVIFRVLQQSVTFFRPR